MTQTIAQNGNAISVDTVEAAAARTAATQKGVTPLDGMTVTQASAWITTNVTDLPSAKVALTHMIKVLFWMNARLTQLESQVKK